MYRNYLRTAIRNLFKYRFYSLLNIFGLAVGLATCLLIWLYVNDELGYDRYNAKAHQIFRVNNEIKFGGNYINLAVSVPEEGPDMLRELPQVEQYTRIQWHGSLRIRKGNTQLQEDRVASADSTLFDVFTLPMIHGDPSTALALPQSIVLSETAARKYFGGTDVVGKTLLVDDTSLYTVTGVIKDVPRQSHFHFDFFVPLRDDPLSRGTDWLGSQEYCTYVVLRPHTDMKKFQADLDRMVDEHVGPQLNEIVHQSLDEFKKSGAFLRSSVTPLLDLHLHSNRQAELDTPGNIEYVWVFSAIAVFILLIACVNFMNLSTARSANRSKEVGVRKVLGSLKRNLVHQFLTESFLISLVAMALAVGTAAVALPFFNELAGKSISAGELFRPAMLGSMVALVVVAGFAAGSYPAFILAAFRPVEVLKGRLAGGFKRSWLRNALVVFQFSISIILMVGTAVIYNQLLFIHKTDLGFDRKNVLVVQHTDVLGRQAPVFRDVLLHTTGVEDATMTEFLPTGYARSGNTYSTTPTITATNSMNMQVWTVDEHYLSTMGMHLVEGRNFSPRYPTDSDGIILNEAAVRFLSLKNPVGKTLYAVTSHTTTKPYRILGVVRNFNFNSLREMVKPLCFSLGLDNGSVSLRVGAGNVREVTDQARKVWARMAPGHPFDYTLMDDDYNHLYIDDQQTGRISVTFSSLAILIACLGLFGLVTFAAEQRTKEIGIRKVLGAKVSAIVSLIARDFLGLVGVAALIAFPVAGWIMHRWLQGFAYRVSLGWWIFAAAGALALIIAMATISYQAVKAALANPVKSLRTE